MNEVNINKNGGDLGIEGLKDNSMIVPPPPPRSNITPPAQEINHSSIGDVQSFASIGSIFQNRVSSAQKVRKRQMTKVLEMRSSKKGKGNSDENKSKVRNSKSDGSKSKNKISGRKRKRSDDNVDLTEKEKVKKRRMRNREAAQRSREKKKIELKKLQDENDQMKRRITTLEVQNSSMLTVLRGMEPGWNGIDPFPGFPGLKDLEKDKNE